MSDSGKRNRDRDKPDPATEPTEPDKDSSTELPLWFRLTALSLMLGLAIVHVIIDAYRDSYEGQATSLLLFGIIGSAIGADQYLRANKDGKK